MPSATIFSFGALPAERLKTATSRTPRQSLVAVYSNQLTFSQGPDCFRSSLGRSA